MIASLNETGKAGVVMDNGVLFRSRSEKKIRKPILEDDLVEAVIALPEKLFYNTDSPGCILILNKDKPDDREGTVQFINAADQTLRGSGIKIYEEESSQNRLTEKGIQYVAETFLHGRVETHHSRTVELEEIAENNWNLNVPRYVDTTPETEDIDVQKKMEELDDITDKISENTSRLQSVIEQLY
jgi:type I restriction enzyme M protein